MSHIPGKRGCVCKTFCFSNIFITSKNRFVDPKCDLLGKYADSKKEESVHEESGEYL